METSSMFWYEPQYCLSDDYRNDKEFLQLADRENIKCFYRFVTHQPPQTIHISIYNCFRKMDETGSTVDTQAVYRQTLREIKIRITHYKSTYKSKADGMLVSHCEKTCLKITFLSILSGKINLSDKNLSEFSEKLTIKLEFRLVLSNYFCSEIT